MHLVQQFILRIFPEPLLFPPKPCPRPCAHAVPAAPLGHLAPVQASFKCVMPANERLFREDGIFSDFRSDSHCKKARKFPETQIEENPQSGKKSSEKGD